MFPVVTGLVVLYTIFYYRFWFCRLFYHRHWRCTSFFLVDCYLHSHFFFLYICFIVSVFPSFICICCFMLRCLEFFLLSLLNPDQGWRNICRLVCLFIIYFCRYFISLFGCCIVSYFSLFFIFQMVDCWVLCLYIFFLVSFVVLFFFFFSSIFIDFPSYKRFFFVVVLYHVFFVLYWISLFFRSVFWCSF